MRINFDWGVAEQIWINFWGLSFFSYEQVRHEPVNAAQKS